MTSNLKSSNPFGAGPTPLEAVERAMSDLRRGLPVVIAMAGQGLPMIAAELANSEGLARFGDYECAVYLTHGRAQALKIPQFTAEAVSVCLPAQDAAAFARHLADPTFDLDQPCAGPFRAGRPPLPSAVPAAIELLKLSGLLPALIAPLAADRVWIEHARSSGISIADAGDIERYEDQAVASLMQIVSAQVPLADAENARVIAFRAGAGGPESLAIVVGAPDFGKPVLVRLHSQCFTGDLLASLRCDCGEQLRGAIRRMSAESGGILLYLAQEGRGIGLMNKLRAYALQDQGFDTFEANERLGFKADERVFARAAVMLKMIGVKSVRLLTNNPKKADSLKSLGIEVAETLPHSVAANVHNRRYLEAKAKKSGHKL